MDKRKRTPYILVVDDNPQNLQFLGEVLSSKNYRIGIAQNGVKALESVQFDQPDLILLDVMMPKMDGFETCKRLKQNPSTKQIPVVFLTAKVEHEDVVKGFELGAVDYITKPFNPTELLVRIGTHLKLKFSEETILSQRDELNEMLHILSHDLSNHIGSIVTGLELGIKRPERLEKLAHSMKNCGLQALELINLVRTLRAISAKKEKLILKTIFLKQAFQKSFSILEGQFQKKGIELRMIIDEEIEVIAEQSSLINSVINNLFTNAIKFSYPKSEIVVTARQQENEVFISIKDSGIGIPKDLLENIFSKCKVTARFGTDGEKGTGFGMPLVQKFIKIYGGQIKIISEEETENSTTHGTDVQITLKSPK